MDDLSQKLAGDDVSAKEMKQRLEETEVTHHEEEALAEITELFKEMQHAEGEERRSTSESIVQAAKRWPEKVGKHSEKLEEFVEDDNYYVRKNAAFALGLVGGERHIELLEQVADRDEDLEEVANWSVERIKSERGSGADQEATPQKKEEAEGEAKSESKDVDQDEESETQQEETGTEEIQAEDGTSDEPEDESGSTEVDERTQETTQQVAEGSSLRFYREIVMTLYAQGEGHQEAVEQAGVHSVESTSYDPLFEELEGEGEGALMAAGVLERVSEKDPGALREDVSKISAVLCSHDDDVEEKLESALVNVARETPESLVEELSKRG